MDNTNAKIFIIFSIILILIVLFASSFVSAGFFDFFNKITGRASTTGTVSINISVGAGTAPAVLQIYNNSFIQSGITLNDGPSDTNITINFSVTDADGAANINTTSAVLNISKTGQAGRTNYSCNAVTTGSNTTNFSCRVTLYWFDGDGVWTINASVKDLSENNASNASTVLTINTLTGFVAAGSLAFSAINPGSYNNTATGALRLNNTGNQPIYSGGISVNATHLVGESDGKNLTSGNFSISNNTGAAKPECDFINNATNATGGKAINLSEISGNAFIILNGTYVNATLPRGNFTVNNGETGQEDLYLCLRTAGPELIQQAYSTASQGAWTLKITVI